MHILGYDISLSKLAERPRPSILTKEFGSSGTDISQGFVNEEFTAALQDSDGMEKYDQMAKTDGSIAALLRAVKLPILQANWFIEPASEEKEDIEKAEFIEQALFEKLDKPWGKTLEDMLRFLEYGVIALEKVYKIEDGIVWLDKLAYRKPTSYLKWELDDGSKGLVQWLPTPNERGETETQIPAEKLVLFHNEKEGENWWGTSILRQVYKHWFMKDNLYRFDMIASERFSVGVPIITLPENSTGSDRTDAIDMAKNMRANQESYLVLPSPEWKVDILTGGAAGQARDLQPSIMHHDRQISKSILAQVIDLGQQTGTQALAGTITDLFLTGVESWAKNIMSTMEPVIQEMIDLNFEPPEAYPRLSASGIRRADTKDLSLALERMFNAGGVTPDLPTEQWIRETLGMPEKNESLVLEPIPAPVVSPTTEKPKVKPDAEQEEIIKEDAELKEVKKKLQSKPAASKREREFLQDITSYEKELQDFYLKIEDIVEVHEDKLRKFLKKGYSKAKTQRVGGSERITRKGNAQLESKMKSGVKMIMESLRKKIASKPVADKIMNKAAKAGNEAFINITKNTETVSLAEVIVPIGTMNSFAAGYISNLGDGVIQNTERQTIEGIIENFGSSAPIRNVIDNADLIQVNRNNLKLSTVTHPRGLYKQVISDKAAKEGYTHYKFLVPNNVLKPTIEDRPSGETARNLFLIGTFTFWANRRDDKVSNPMGFSFHHGSQEYFLPIPEEDLEEEQELSKEQRSWINQQTN